MARKGQFKKGGGRVGAARRARHASPKAMTKYRTRTVTKYRTRSAPKKHHARRRGRHSGGGMNLLHLGAATLGLAYVTSAKGPEFIRTNVAKIPGSATFGTAATVGIAALAVDRFVKPNKWLKLLGAAGIVLAASKVGEQGSDFKWVGDEDDIGDIGDDDDLGDDDDIGDYED